VEQRNQQQSMQWLLVTVEQRHKERCKWATKWN